MPDDSAYRVMPAKGPPGLCAALSDLGDRVRASSNFRCAWHFFRLYGLDPRSAEAPRHVLDAVVTVEGCHEFLRSSFEALYNESFEVEPLHEHCSVEEASGEFEDVLAAAAGDRLGAYSRDLRPSTEAEKASVAKIFEMAGPYLPSELRPGAVPGCPECAHHNNHVFSTWFYGVAWDWTFVVIWPSESLAWVGCLTDTD